MVLGRDCSHPREKLHSPWHPGGKNPISSSSHMAGRCPVAQHHSGAVPSPGCVGPANPATHGAGPQGGSLSWVTALTREHQPCIRRKEANCPSPGGKQHSLTALGTALELPAPHPRAPLCRLPPQFVQPVALYCSKQVCVSQDHGSQHGHLLSARGRHHHLWPGTPENHKVVD